MADPVILTVDDDPQVRNAVERDLGRKYGADYPIIKAGSGAEALDAVRQLKERNAPVALFLVDQLMPGMSGTEFLTQALKLYPEARRVLLTAHADRDANRGCPDLLRPDYCRGWPRWVRSRRLRSARVVMIEQETTGGQAGTSPLIQNYLRFPRGLSGAQLGFSSEHHLTNPPMAELGGRTIPTESLELSRQGSSRKRWLGAGRG